MSSIYKKGRDGYFYYQIYVFNPETGKKDKKIFHSLGTKDVIKARSKQELLDKRYENKNNYKSKWKKYYIPIILSAFIIYKLFFKNTSISRTQDFSNNNSKFDSIEDTFKLNNDFKTHIHDKGTDLIKSTVKNIEANIVVDKKKLTLIKKESPKKLPNYHIERVEKLSESYDQIKIYILIESDTESSTIKIVCQKIKDQYPGYSNIIICVYSNDQNGLLLARGSNQEITIKDQTLSWLAFYSINKVEGEYFDDNPVGYLGAY